MRKIAAMLGMALLAGATLASHRAQPIGLFVRAAAADDVPPPALLVTPCEIGPRTLPIVNPERDA